MSFLVRLVVVGSLLSPPASASALDSRFENFYSAARFPIEHPENGAVRFPATGNRPQVCAIRRTVDLDVQPKGRRWASDTPDPAFIERVAPLREYELGFARAEGSSRIDAFMRFRFEPLADGRPVPVERPVVYYDGEGYNSEGWTPTGLDAEGFSGARFDIDGFEGIDLWLFMRQIWHVAMVAVTLPATGEDRVYWLGHRDDFERPSKADLVACLYAFGDDRISREVPDELACDK
ncbi:MAG: hypothetical protein GC202_09605 [Alphaproteobacteria bacterium]|nr:hypothetical protein [Alphaproteobacteria bacterium]